MVAWWIGWVLAGGLAGVESLTRTFYLLGLGVAFAVGGGQAVNRQVAGQYINAYINAILALARTTNTAIMPAKVADIAGVIVTAMTVVRRGGDSRAPG